MDPGHTTQAVLEIGEPIGAGMYGVVSQCRYNTRKVAIKKFQLHRHTTDQVEIIEREIGLLTRLQHRHIIQFYGVHRQGNEISLVMDFAEGGSLKEAIEDSRVGDWQIKSRIAQEIAYGLAYIHHESILHRDLKSDNVLLTGLMEVKLSDFGLAMVKTSSGGYSTEVLRGTIRWRAPELLMGELPRYTNKSDMYALGMVMWEMAALCTLPFKTINSNFVVAGTVHGGEREKLPHNTPPDYRRWIDLCWKQDPSDRPDAHEVIIMDDALSQHQRASTETSLELDAIFDDSSSRSSETEGPAASQLPMEIVSLNHRAVLNEVDAQVSLAEMYETGGAMDRVGDMYTEGRGSEQSHNEAVRWHKQAMDQRRSASQASAGIASQEVSQAVERILGAMSWFHTKSRDSLMVMQSSIRSAMNVLVIAQGSARAFTNLQALTRGDETSQPHLGRMECDIASRSPEHSDVEVVRWCAKAANQGDPSGQVNLGWMYEIGRGVQHSDVEAVKWYTKAASQGDPRGQFNLGWMYETGRGVKQSDFEAVKWYTKAAIQRNPNAQNKLGVMCNHGQGIEQSDAEAVNWFIKAASQGNPNAQFNLGCMYENGQGVEQSDVEAVKWFSNAASQGNPNAQNNLALMYETGRGVEQSDVEAVRLYTKAAIQGNANAQNNLALMYGNGRGVLQSDVEAAKWYSKAASQGDLMAQKSLGAMYLDGRGVEQSDVEAVKWYTKAATQGDSNAQNNLGWMYALGQGVRQDDILAVEWYQKSSAQDNAYGHGNLASMYELGFGVKASDLHALDLFTRAHNKGYPIAHFHVKWLMSSDRRTPCSDSDAVEVNRIGAERGYVAAQHNLGRLYERGKGVRKDRSQALIWYRKAAEQGHTDSQQWVEFLQRQ
ncbi:hypothetical protein DFQ27_003737 [Actinomortierella ambigua]|uniref:Protein kinase domain-containing protein n=1 Tax=Actinomortierella ambigua TaxID=1343610 RepID=A0A9P6Q403_9FUNG|nr:hypothetical protein DFQ27_003737 [Actinomortierella ambigua]